MRAADILLCLLCVGCSAVGQVLMRAASLAAVRSGVAGPLAWLNGTMLVAVCVYVAAMALWMFVLSRVPLTQAFAFFGLSFFIVPALAHRFFGDPVSLQTWLGAGIIMLGIVVTNWRAA
ncbi:EamA family transporter [Rubrivivax sp. RP6-9]|uniref:EamA family transporter n=1 Tax=Rubrivivax sp. RP6-9 TaxID=3415750 RepID=UPI003CC5A9BA